MKNRLSSTYASTLLMAGAIAALFSASPSGQTSRFQPPADVPGAEAVKAFVTAHMAKGFTPTRTPWGDPDIQGVFTTKDEANTPFERPAEWAGRRMADIGSRSLIRRSVRGGSVVSQRQVTRTSRADLRRGAQKRARRSIVHVLRPSRRIGAGPVASVAR